MPIRRALVIGINYARLDAQLNGPQKGASLFRQLLIDRFNFLGEDILLMIDDAEDSRLRPTKVNIVRQLKQLVSGAQAKDFLVFYYAGHVEQIPCKDHTEDDGKDEAILALDSDGIEKRHGHGLITDNFLHRVLVGNLPSGVVLRAIFDACHSATLLDLKHGACNDRRFQNSTKRVHPKRTHSSPSIIPLKRRSMSIHQAVKELRDLDEIESGVNILQPGSLVAQSACSTDKENIAPLWRSKQASNSSIASLQSGPSQSSCSSDDAFRTYPLFDCVADAFLQECTECSSPLSSEMSTSCDGLCQIEIVEKDVVSFSACTDAQLAWENPQGISMTQMLIHLLDQHPHASYKDILAYTTDRLDESMHGLRKRCRARGFGPPEYQDPQLASMHPLDLNDSFML